MIQIAKLIDDWQKRFWNVQLKNCTIFDRINVDKYTASQNRRWNLWFVNVNTLTSKRKFDYFEYVFMIMKRRNRWRNIQIENWRLDTKRIWHVWISSKWKKKRINKQKLIKNDAL